MDSSRSTLNMSEVDDITEDFLTCPLCTEEYTDPKALPCLHTFCMQCITEHILESTRGHLNPKGFDCPVCHRFTDPNTTTGPHSWSEFLESNQFVTGLLDAVKLRSEARMCDLCYRRKNKKCSASKWCEECGDTMCNECGTLHGCMRYSSNHHLLDIEEVKLQPIKSTVLRTPCPEHDGKFLDFYCEDHSQVICSTCATLKHRKCDSVLSCSDAAHKRKEDARTTVDKLRYQTDWASRILDNRSQSIVALEDTANQITKQVSNFRQQINDLLTAKENRILEDLKNLKLVEAQQFETEMERCEELVSTTRNAMGVLYNAVHHGTDTDLLVALNGVQRETKSSEKQLKEMSKNLNDAVLTFTPEIKLQTFFSELKEMGKISSTRLAIQVPPLYSVKTMTQLPIKLDKPDDTIESEDADGELTPEPAKVGKKKLMKPKARKIQSAGKQASIDVFFKARTHQDRDNCCLTGADFVSDGRVVLVDQNQRKLKLFDDKYKFVGEKVLSARPFDATTVSGNEVAVTLPKEKRVLLFSVRNTDFIVITSFPIGSKCWGISYNQYKFAVCCFTSPPSIKIISRDGKELVAIKKDQSGQDLFYFPEYVAMDKAGKNLYVTDRYRKSIISVTTQGEKRWERRVSGLKNPKGVAIHGNRVFVIGWKSNNVVQMSTEGEVFGVIIGDGLSSPHKLCVTQDGERIMVTQHQITLIDVEKNTVKLFVLP